MMAPMIWKGTAGTGKSVNTPIPDAIMSPHAAIRGRNWNSDHQKGDVGPALLCTPHY